ncbi:MAG TPA: cytochrome c oxidase assembly protein [Steroidobacteraceae bacterium]
MPTTLALLRPWAFSPTVLLTTGLAVTLYVRGAGTVPIPYPRRIAYFAGVGLLYAALQTSWDYYASHMFFVLQLQHFVLHDLGPALLAAAAPGATLLGGLPRWARPRLQTAARALHAPANALLDARVATALYIVSQLVWLLPPIFFEVMLSNRLYQAMTWSTVLGALPFWHLMLDPRSYPRARLRLRHRFFALYLAMLPMTLVSAALAFSQTNWYPVYAICGRFLPISPVMDQELGGTAMWVPGATLVAIVLFLFLARKLDQAEIARHRTGAAPLISNLAGTSPGHANPRRETAGGPA